MHRATPFASKATASLAITMGDPCGIGPEIVVKAIAGMTEQAQPLVIGSSARLEQAAAICKVAAPQRVVECGDDVSALPWGQVSAIAGRASFGYVQRGIEMALQHDVAALVTAPINKAAWSAAGITFPGHTEMLAEYAGVSACSMMLANKDLRVVLVTIHCALREAIERISMQAELAAIRRAHQAMLSLGISVPRVAVAGLNPHAGEDGLFGREDIEVIAPAIVQAQREGIDASGPWSGDTVFMHARKGRFDVVVAQYHDQGLIPVKYLGVDEGVNVTLGLPFVRTSPDHGTAFDIAGQGIASAASLQTAMDYAVQLVQARLTAAERMHTIA
jgi:4-phospho-D-threonate 3-dehydrogenase / 4-phospho-D-erythronate 3-dehydrogenase